MFIVSILVLFLIYYLYIFYINNLNRLKDEEIFKIYKEKLKKEVLEENKRAIVNLEAENMKLIKDLAEREKNKEKVTKSFKNCNK
jgi:predicted Holliday junction resolvase-like endonuclease